MAKDRPPPSTFVDRTLDLTFPLNGDSYDILWREAGLFPVDMSDMPVALGPERQFFIDDYLIESLTGTRQALNPAEKVYHNPIIRPERPWEGNDVRVSNVIYEEKEGVFRMWYSGQRYSARQGEKEIIIDSKGADIHMARQKVCIKS
mgnify:CR=1 FL=1